MLYSFILFVYLCIHITPCWKLVEIIITILLCLCFVIFCLCWFCVSRGALLSTILTLWTFNLPLFYHQRSPQKCNLAATRTSQTVQYCLPSCTWQRRNSCDPYKPEGTGNNPWSHRTLTNLWSQTGSKSVNAKGYHENNSILKFLPTGCQHCTYTFNYHLNFEMTVVWPWSPSEGQGHK